MFTVKKYEGLLAAPFTQFIQYDVCRFCEGCEASKNGEVLFKEIGP